MGNRWAIYQRNSQNKAGSTKVGSGLTQREMKAIRFSWKKVSADMKTNGTSFFIKFFECHPAYKDYFPAFRDKTVEDLHRSLILQAHGISVMYSFTTLVENLNDETYFMKFMKQSVRSHHSRGVSLQQYEEMFEVLIVFLEEKLGDAFNDDTRRSWERFAEQFSLAVEQVRAQAKLGPITRQLP